MLSSVMGMNCCHMGCECPILLDPLCIYFTLPYHYVFVYFTLSHPTLTKVCTVRFPVRGEGCNVPPARRTRPAFCRGGTRRDQGPVSGSRRLPGVTPLSLPIWSWRRDWTLIQTYLLSPLLFLLLELFVPFVLEVSLCSSLLFLSV